MPKEVKLPQFESKRTVRMTREVLVMFAKGDYGMELNSRFPFPVCNLLKLCCTEDALSALPKTTKVRWEGHRSLPLAIKEKEEVGLG